MLKSLLTKNILSHKKTKVNFSSGVNMFIGLSGKGKSAFFQSLNWVISLRPNGDEHRSWDGGKMVSKLTLDTGEIITLSRDKQNVYKLKKGKEDTLTFKAFGQRVPENIKKIINIDPKVNIQKQLERGVPIFLISESPGDIAKFFNRVAGLDKIDKVLKTGKDSLRESENKVSVLKDSIKEKKEELKKYDCVDDVYQKIVKADKMANLISKNENIIDSIDHTLIEIKDIQNIIKNQKNKTKTKTKIEDILNRYKCINKLEKSRKEIESISEDIFYCETDIQSSKNRQSGIPKINMGLSIIKAVSDLKRSKDILQTITNKIKRQQDVNKSERKELKHKQMKFRVSFPDKCPLCDTILKEDI